MRWCFRSVRRLYVHRVCRGRGEFSMEKETMKNSKLGWYLLCLAIGAILGIVVFNKIGWIF